jgi:hypothetical protein
MRLYLKKPKDATDSRFFNKNGTLTAYSFACGYVEMYQSMELVPYHVFIASPPFNTMTPQIEIKVYKDSSVFIVQFSDYSEKGDSTTFYYDTIGETRWKVRELKRKVSTW